MGTSRRIKRRIKARRAEDDLIMAMREVGMWEEGLMAHFQVTVRRLMMAGHREDSAQLMAYKAIVAGLRGDDLQEAAEEIVECSGFGDSVTVKIGDHEFKPVDGDSISIEAPKLRTAGHEFKEQAGDEVVR